MITLIERDESVRRIALGTPAGLLAFGLGSGLSRFAPGTMGTIVAVPFAILLKYWPATVYWPVLAFLFLAGIYVCGVTAKRLGKDDPGGIVWDEMVGYWLTVALVPYQWPWWLAAFLLFRCFDVLKPWPVRWAERRFSGGLGIMLDDVLAALYAMAVLELLKLAL